ncbi:hypothetical protein M127_5509 [Bacteroides fragilis str. S6L5]|nr:hypothetical protein M127_5509 [Bacteroides fragilis str. S6L5]
MPVNTIPAINIRLPVTNIGEAASIANLLKANDEDQIKAVRKIKKTDMKRCIIQQ